MVEKVYKQIHIGVDVGQSVDPTAVVIVEPEVRETVIHHEAYKEKTATHMVQHPAWDEKVKEVHYMVRKQRRLPLGLSYVSIIEEIKRSIMDIPKQENVELSILMWIDATGVGKPVADLISKELPGIILFAVYLTGGEAKEAVKVLVREVNLPKAYLVSRLQVLISRSRIHSPDTPEARVMKEELMNYQIKVNENANAQFGAFKVGTHDDLVTALGLACLYEPAMSAPSIRSANPRSRYFTKETLRGYW